MTNILPKGHFSKLLVMDCETSGLNNFSEDISEGYQSVSWGLIIVDAQTLKPIDELYLEIKWNKKDRWEIPAERVHGLNRQYLEENGLDEVDAATAIAEFLLEHFKIDDTITLVGQNVMRFDRAFFKKLLYKFGLKFKFSHRCVDTFSLGFATIGAFNSDQMFEELGYPIRDKHNALEDAYLALKTLQDIRSVWNNCIGAD